MKQKKRQKIIVDGFLGKLFLRSFSLFFSADFSMYSFLKNSWKSYVYQKSWGSECHGNHRPKLSPMLFCFNRTFVTFVYNTHSWFFICVFWMIMLPFFSHFWYLYTHRHTSIAKSFPVCRRRIWILCNPSTIYIN